MPTPREGESEQDFVSRCMAYPDMQKHEPKQRAAICYSMFRKESMHPDFQRIIKLFFNRYKVADAIRKFSEFTTKNGLNIAKAYNPKVQFQESFEWIEPLIRPYKEDREAKYYLVTALTADISMNNVDYGPEDRLAREDSSMNWRPVNLNHDHKKWLPYPRTRVDFSAANEFSLEATLRVDNEDSWLQRKLDSGEILHPSIEGRPHPIGGRYHFTAMALLEKGAELPGSPLSEIVPLVFNESVGRSICEFKDGKMVCECDPKLTEVKSNLKESVIKEAIKEVLQEQARTDAERARAHFKISDQEWSKLSDKEKQTYIDKLPPRGSHEEQVDKPMLTSPQQSNPNAEKPPKEPEECPTGFHWDGQQCAPNDSGDSAKSPLTKLPGPRPALYEQDVPPATNAPSTVGKDDTATCPPNQHWDGGKCVDDVKQECEAGWHLDPALQKCVPDNPQVNEQIDKRLADVSLRLDNEHLREENADWKLRNDRLQMKNDLQTKTIFKLEGENMQLKTQLGKSEGQKDRLIAEKIEDAKTIQKLSYSLNDTQESRDTEKALKESVQDKYDATCKTNEKLGAENVQLKADLTEARGRELQWNKDKAELSEGLAKALKHQKYVYEFLKSKGFELVGTS